MPFRPSPNRDNGYDISDFYGVDPRHGSSGDLLTNLLAEDEGRAHDDGAHRIALEEFGYRWFRVGGLGYALRRQPGRPQAQSPG